MMFWNEICLSNYYEYECQVYCLLGSVVLHMDDCLLIKIFSLMSYVFDMSFSSTCIDVQFSFAHVDATCM